MELWSMASTCHSHLLGKNPTKTRLMKYIPCQYGIKTETTTYMHGGGSLFLNVESTEEATGKCSSLPFLMFLHRNVVIFNT